MSNAVQVPNSKEEFLLKLREGHAAWNVWRNANSQIRPDLSKADFKDTDLREFDLRKVNLSEANLVGADLTKCDLTGANLSAADLSDAVLNDARMGKGTVLWNTRFVRAKLADADLGGADLLGATFSNAHLLNTNLREADLHGADLSEVVGGLLPTQLMGADLTGAKLPEPITKLYEKLGSVGEISSSAKKLFQTLLAGCLYSWLTIATTKDVDLISNRASSPLPIIQTAIPIVGFYVVGPIILLCIYFYFHFYLQKLWEELGSLPAIFPDGRPLHARADPWLFNDLVRAHFEWLKKDRPFLSYCQQGMSIVFAWWLVPITLLLFWVRYLPRHGHVGTYFHAAILALSIVAAWRLHRLARDTLRSEERLSFRHSVRRPSVYIGILVALILITAAITISRNALIGSPQGGVPQLLVRIGYSPFADLTDADVSIKPSDWTGQKDEELDRVKGANLVGVNLRYAAAHGVFLAKARLWYAQLEGADLSLSDLMRADFSEAHLSNAKFYLANLSGADLTRTDLRDAHLRGANLTGAYLGDADLTGAELSGRLSPAFEISPPLSKDLTESFIPRKRLSLATTEIKYSNLRGTKGLTTETIKQCINWHMAFFDDDMLKKLGLPKDHNEKLEQQRKLEEQR